MSARQEELERDDDSTVFTGDLTFAESPRIREK